MTTEKKQNLENLLKSFSTEEREYFIWEKYGKTRIYFKKYYTQTNGIKKINKEGFLDLSVDEHNKRWNGYEPKAEEIAAIYEILK